MRSSETKSLENGSVHAERSLGRHSAQNEAPGLYIVATPIGNARDITLRALDVLNACDLIAAEDTRVTAKLLAIHGISKPLTAYNDHNAVRERPRLLARLSAGARVALVSDAGTPLVSDPGYKLVREMLAKGLSVHAIPGPSAALTALTLAGLPTDRFLFAGFLPAKQGERRRALEELRDIVASLIFFESPRRIAETLADMHAVLGERDAAVARELTKLHEEFRRGSLASLVSEFETQSAPKGEITIILGPPGTIEPNFSKADVMLKKAMAHMPLSAAADLIAAALDLPKRAVYERALNLKRADEAR
ncbi:MAG TPA: 16S rRNA (cytidine(1402)-2'-O)-methyltransferase [Rhizomicrobium sp.]|jgi:16S rRNA (cytidine1402-2'-O)-methyltransferase|nr:16S rRNA (cytidine(1402)-2'-O)-methyltransferase [Rhizomicrobium sp.]